MVKRTKPSVKEFYQWGWSMGYVWAQNEHFRTIF